MIKEFISGKATGASLEVVTGVCSLRRPSAPRQRLAPRHTTRRKASSCNNRHGFFLEFCRISAEWELWVCCSSVLWTVAEGAVEALISRGSGSVGGGLCLRAGCPEGWRKALQRGWPGAPRPGCRGSPWAGDRQLFLQAWRHINQNPGLD